MKICGLTGGVGMGKSTAAGFFLQHGARVIDTDELARQLVQPGQPSLAEIQHQFGPSLLASDGTLRRDELARIVFASSSARQKLEGILHPRIRDAWQAQLELWKAEKIPLAIVVIPLLFETQAELYFTKIICAACSAMEQHARLSARGWGEEQIDQRKAAQWSVEEKMVRSHHVLWTEGSINSSAQQVARVIPKLGLYT